MWTTSELLHSLNPEICHCTVMPRWILLYRHLPESRIWHYILLENQRLCMLFDFSFPCPTDTWSQLKNNIKTILPHFEHFCLLFYLTEYMVKLLKKKKKIIKHGKSLNKRHVISLLLCGGSDLFKYTICYTIAKPLSFINLIPLCLILGYFSHYDPE